MQKKSFKDWARLIRKVAEDLFIPEKPHTRVQAIDLLIKPLVERAIENPKDQILLDSARRLPRLRGR